MRPPFISVALPVFLACAHALAQSGGLAGVTMRVVDDLSGIDAVVLELEAVPAENTEDTRDTERPTAEEGEAEDVSDGREEEGAERPAPPPAR